MKRWLFLAAIVASIGTSAASAQDMRYPFNGVHPNHPAKGGFCYNAGVHSHRMPPDPNISYLYRNWSGYNYFMGDPYAFGYTGQAFAYYNHHPVSHTGSYCYLDGSHYHHFLPTADYSPYYVVNNGTYYYNGTLPPQYYSYRSNYYRASHTYRYLPYYRTYWNGYRTAYSTYSTPGSVAYITRPPTMVYRYTSPPVRVYNTTVVRTVATPTYRYNVQQPRTYNSYYRPAATVQRTTTTTVRPSGNVVRTTTTTRAGWRR